MKKWNDFNYSKRVVTGISLICIAISIITLQACTVDELLISCSTLVKDTEEISLSVKNLGEKKKAIIENNESISIEITKTISEKNNKEKRVVNCQPEWTSSPDNLVTLTPTRTGVQITAAGNVEGVATVTASVIYRDTKTSEVLFLAIKPNKSETDLINNDSFLVARDITEQYQDLDAETVDRKKTVVGAFDNPNDVDWYSFKASANQIFQVSLGNSLLNPSGGPFSFPDPLAASELKVIASTAGTLNLSTQELKESDLIQFGKLNIPLINPESHEITVFLKVSPKSAVQTDNIPYHINLSKRESATNNIPPTAIANSYKNITAGTEVILDVLKNDIDRDSDLSSKIMITSGTPLNGIAEATSGKVKYTANSTFKGKDIFFYKVEDVDGNLSNEAHVEIEVIPFGQPQRPIAENDVFTLTNSGAALYIDVLVNDVDANGGKSEIKPNSITITKPALNGEAMLDIASGKVKYTPTDATFIGFDEFQYTFTDIKGVVSNEGAVLIELEGN